MANTIDALLGLSWGDEGKGKIIDVLTPKYDIIARFQGGPNAGHTLEFNGQKHVLHLIPSGIFHEGKKNLLGNGMVIDPIALQKEIEGLLPYISMEELQKRIVIADGAILILPTHRLLDQAYEAAKKDGKIGTTGKGIGPAYTDHISRTGLHIRDIQQKNYTDKFITATTKHGEMLEFLKYDFDGFDLMMQNTLFHKAVEFLQRFNIVNGPEWLDEQLNAGKKVLAEGAQGTFLDINFGTYPFVTSSNTTAGGICTGLGIAPNRIGKIYGLFKAYCTRVGEGPFPTELFDETGKLIQKKGNEVGATTGRPRRCGWLDIPKLKEACRLNGVTNLVMSKADVLSGLKVSVCTTYDEKGNAEYINFSEWEDIEGSVSYQHLPTPFKNYVEYIEAVTQTEITIISTGPDRDQIIIR